MPHLFCFGLGYTAQVFGRMLMENGWRVSGTCQSADKRNELEAMGFDMVLFDGKTRSDEVVARINQASHLLQSIAPGENGDKVLQVLHADIKARASQFNWLGYLSTTAVYGDRQGGWVDETSDTNPGMKRGLWRCRAEEQWLELCRNSGLAVHVFRLAGIYGPKRNQLEKLRQKKARRIIKPGQFFSRIHVQDIARTLKASIDSPKPGAVYNVCDNEAAPPQDVIEFAAKLLGIDPPPEEPFDAAVMSDMARSFYSESKKVSNEKIKTELKVELKYPTYREGMQALAAGA